jgi:hypothetical protein
VACLDKAYQSGGQSTALITAINTDHTEPSVTVPESPTNSRNPCDTSLKILQFIAATTTTAAAAATTADAASSTNAFISAISSALHAVQ